MPLIAVEDAAFAYEGSIAVSGLHFEVNDGDYICVAGENGSGKSTLLKGLLRLKQPVAGRVTFSESLKSGEVGYLPQQTAAQKDFPASVYEVVLSGRLSRRGMRPFYSKADKAAAEENMRRLDIFGLRSRCYGELSGGEQRRALLARALCAARKMLLLDEPVAGLDPLAAQDLYRQIDNINRETGVTVVMVSHDIHSAVQYASRILHLSHTQLFFGSAADYVRSPIGIRFNGGEQHA